MRALLHKGRDYSGYPSFRRRGLGEVVLTDEFRVELLLGV